jgi:predicted O-linked N-acetylglucosamine transferase (SPINDLY family)
MGTPLVTLKGEAAASRIGATFLQQLGRAEWVAETAEDFVRIACALATDVDALNTIRHSLRPAMQASALLNEAQFAADFGEVLQDMWRTWCNSDAALPAKQAYEQQESLQLCGLLLERQDYQSAMAGYQAVLSQYPACLEALYGLGLAILLNGDARTALPVLRKVNDTLQEHQETMLRADCLVALANACEMLGQEQDAQRFLMESLDLRPSEEIAKQLLALTQKGAVLH